jgi:hypothetical protein
MQALQHSRQPLDIGGIYLYQGVDIERRDRRTLQDSGDAPDNDVLDAVLFKQFEYPAEALRRHLILRN